MMPAPPPIRIGIDLGGTKIAGVALDPSDNVIAETRVKTPRNDYPATLGAIAAVVADLTSRHKAAFSIGVGMPGSIVPNGQTVQNANSTWLNGRSFQADLEDLLGQSVRCANDANCFALSEAHDGAAAGGNPVFGVILGTGCGGGIVVDGRLVNGPRNIGGEWGHNPLPWPEPDEVPGPACWCGRHGCLETWISGPALAADHERATGERLTGEAIAGAARGNMPGAQATMDRHLSRLARGLAHVVNLIDPEIIVLGGGLSNLAHLYAELPRRMAPFIFSQDRSIEIRPPRWGDASGVRGAARLRQG